MRVPVSWLREYVRLPADVPVEDLAERLTALGLKLEALESPGADVTGPLVVGRVLEFAAEEHKNGKTVRWCQVDVGAHNATGPNTGAEPRGIVCGADNFAVDDLVVVALPGAVLPGGFAISARKTYGHVSDGMICSARELGLGDDHAGIIVLGPGEGEPGEDAAALLHLRDDVIEFEINPDRAYALSVRGVAREAAIAYDVAFTDPAAEPVPAEDDAAYPVVVDDPAGCPVFVTRTVTGFDPAAPSPRWLARRVQLAGMRPISLAVDVTNYVMLELGQPIHAYDGSALRGAIVVRRAGRGERLTTLDGVTRTLDAEDLLITDDSGPIGLAGVMGGSTTEIGAGTTEIVVEAASFAPVTVGRTARRHRLPSEASRRFERGVDPALPARAAERVAELLTTYGGGKIEPGRTVVGQPPARTAIPLPVGLAGTVTGMPIEPDTVVATLRRVGCEIVGDGREGVDLSVTPPTWRHDITDPHDLVEEVARQVGYDRVPSVLPPAPAGRGLTTEQRLRRRVGYALAGAGFVETMSYPFVGPADWTSLGLADDDPRRNTLRVANPISEQEPELRTTLLPGLLRTLARNAGRGHADVALFETAAVFHPDREPRSAPILGVDRRPTPAELADLEAAVPDQPRHLGLVLAGDREPVGWWGTTRPASWADAVGAVRRLGETLGVEVTVSAARRAPWHPGRCAEVTVAGAVVGYAGELHPKVCTAYGIPARTAAAEVDLDALLASAARIVSAPSFSTYPVAKEDVALLVDASVPAADVEAALRAGAGELLERIRLFDVYAGDQIPAGKKSLAFALRFRAPDRTLTEAETGAARDAAVAAAAERVGAEQRG